MILDVRLCRKDGCAWHDQEPGRSCAGCGFFGPEADRRKTLPLRKGEDGLRRMDVSNPEPKPAGADAPETRPSAPTDAEACARLYAEELRIAVTIMEAAGLCIHEDRSMCRREDQSPRACRQCIKRWIRRKAESKIGQVQP